MGKSAIAPPKERLPYQEIASTVLLLKTNFIPSVKLCITGSLFGFILVSYLFVIKPAKKNTKHIDQCTPIKVIEKPAKAGPITLNLPNGTAM
jgi:hypothetical protein